MLLDIQFGQQTHRLHMPRVCNKDAPSRDLFVKSWIFMMLWLRSEPEIWLLHPDASAIEKIRIVFIGEPLTGFGLICDLLFAMAFAANCNFTIVYCFRVGFPKMKWAEENPQILFDLEAFLCSFYSIFSGILTNALFSILIIL